MSKTIVINAFDFDAPPARPSEKRGVVGLALMCVKCFAIALLIVAAVIVSQMGFDSLMESGYFDVKEIGVSGASVVEKKKILEQIGPVFGQNVFDLDIKAIGIRLESHPWIKNVEVRRKLPNNLTVHITERKPVVIAVLGDEWLMDEDGVALKKPEPQDRKGLPILTGAKAKGKTIKAGQRIDVNQVRPAIEALKRLSGYKLFGKYTLWVIDVSKKNRLEIFFTGSRVKLIMPKWRWSDEAQRLRVVDYILRGKKGNVKSIDLTFRNKVVVTYPEV